jgi:hypothetical protein
MQSIMKPGAHMRLALVIYKFQSSVRLLSLKQVPLRWKVSWCRPQNCNYTCWMQVCLPQRLARSPPHRLDSWRSDPYSTAVFTIAAPRRRRVSKTCHVCLLWKTVYLQPTLSTFIKTAPFHTSSLFVFINSCSHSFHSLSCEVSVVFSTTSAVRSSASSFNLQYLVFSSRSSSSCLLLLPRLPL